MKVSHAKAFDAEEVKETLGLSEKRMLEYKERATFLTTKRAKDEDVVEYFSRLYPSATKEVSRPAKNLMEILNLQPGAELGAGTWWAPYNAQTFYTDHIYGRDTKDKQGCVDTVATQDNRLANAWYGPNRNKKMKALELALDYANKS